MMVGGRGLLNSYSYLHCVGVNSRDTRVTGASADNPADEVLVTGNI